MPSHHVMPVNVRGERSLVDILVFAHSAPWWAAWLTFFLGMGLGFFLGLAAVIIRAG